MNTFTQLAEKIIKEQESMIGPMAWDEAKKVKGLDIQANNTINIHGEGKEVLAGLAQQYEKIFGHTSIEVCKEAIADAKKEDLPAILQ